MSTGQCILARWLPVTGDIGAAEWLMVAGYALAALACLAAARAQALPAVRRYWLVFGAGLLVLMVNKPLDLHAALTAAGYCMAKAQGWYDHRRAVQAAFLVLLTAGSLVLARAALREVRPHLPALWLSLAGLGGLLAFIALRAGGVYHAGELIGLPRGPLWPLRLLEAGALAAVALNAARQTFGRAR